MMNKKLHRIAIVGAGPGGLLLARMLTMHGFSVSMFERDESASVRAQGGSLDLHPDTGQYALKCAGLMDDFKRIARYEDQGMKLYDQYGKIVLEKANAAEGDRPEVDRTQLRDLLLRSIPPATMCWGHCLAGIQQKSDNSVELCFKNGTIRSFDLVIGADGAWSRVRPLVSAAKPIYSGVTMFELRLDDVDNSYPHIADLVGRGMMVAKGGGKTIFAQRNANAIVRIYASPRQQEKSYAVHEPGSSSEVMSKAELLRQFEGWSNMLLQLIELPDGPIKAWPVYALPVGHRWENRPGISLLGDAAHLMPPAGQGANLALRDAADLAIALSSDSNWMAAIRNYELAMFSRAESAAAQSRDMMEQGSSEQGLKLMQEVLQNSSR